MLESFLKLIGVGGDMLEHLDKAELAFQRPAVLWAGLLLLIPVGYYIYRRQRENLSTVPKKFRIALSVTRILVLAILIGVLSGPYLKYDHKITKKPIVAILFDRSQSMQLPAGPFDSDKELLSIAAAAGYETTEGKIDADTRKALNRIGRSELAQTVVRVADESLVKLLQKDYEVKFYTFDREVAELVFDTSGTEVQGLASDGGTASHLGEAIFHVLDEAAGQEVSAIFLFTDGQNTGGRSPSQAARASADAKAPIYPIPLGSSRRVQDVSVIDVYSSGLVAVGDTVRVNVTLESQGFDGRPVKIELKDGDEVLDTEERVVRSDEQQQIELTFEAKTPGARYLTVNVPPLKEESDELRANNTDTVFVRISEEKLKVLFIDGTARWDFRFLKNAIRRDNGLAGRSQDEPDIVVEAEWRRWQAEKKQAEKKKVEQKQSVIPKTLEDISAYHTVIIGDASPDIISSDFRKILIQAVREKGVGLIVSAGTQSMPHRFDQEFQDLLPVQLRDNAAGMEAAVYRPFRLEITPEGVIHEAMRLYDDPGRNQNVWGRMPPYYWCAAATRASAAATVLAWNPSVEGRYGKMPLIAFHYAGDGKVMFVGTDSTWLWRQNVGDRFFYKFWGQSIRFVARKDESGGKQSWIEVRPVRAQPGEEAEIELMAVKADGTPQEASKLKITLLGPGSRDTVDVLADKNKKGRYTGKFTPKQAGVHRISYQPSDGSKTVEAAIRVLVAPEEFRHPNMNLPVLELLAGTSGGKVVPLSELETIPERLKGESSLRELHREATVWDNWLTLLMLVMIYSTDVGLRRIMGLS